MRQQGKTLVPKDIQQQLRGQTRHERLLHRLHSITLALSGYSASEIARIHGDSPRAVAYWVKRFNDGGIGALEEDQRPGRPSRIDQQQMRTLQSFIKRAKRRDERLNAKMVAEFILSEFRISLTARQCWRILNKLKS